MTALAIHDLSVHFGPRAVLQSLTLPDLPAGELTVLAGPNGAGKSTLLRAIAQLSPHKGQITLGGENLARLSGQARAAKIGFMPQTLPSGSSLIVLECVIASLRAGGAHVHAPEVTALETLERLGIAPLAFSRLDQLSGGQRQMVSLAQAIVRNPRILLLDEPTSALDLRYQARLLTEIRRLAAEGRVVIAVLHDLSLAARWADHIVVMQAGRLHSSGTPDTVLTPDMLAEVYGVAARVERCTAGRTVVLVDREL